MRDGRHCTLCKEYKNRTMFYAHKSGINGLQPRCKECCNAVRRAAVKDGGAYAEKNRARATKWREVNIEKARDTSRRRYAEKADEVAAYRLANRGQILSYLSNWHKLNRSKSTAYSSARNAQKIRATPVWANGFFIEEVYELAARRTSMLGVDFQVDHIVPLRSNLVCGLHCEANMQVITKTENMSKGNRCWPNMPA